MANDEPEFVISPCPFCGAHGTDVEVDRYLIGLQVTRYIFCTKCHAHGPEALVVENLQHLAEACGAIGYRALQNKSDDPDTFPGVFVRADGRELRFIADSGFGAIEGEKGFEDDRARATTGVINEAEITTTYAVFAPGWGRDYLWPTTGLGSGDLAYKGRCLRLAQRVLRKMRREIKSLRQQPGLKNASHAYALYSWRSNEDNWKKGI